MSCCHTRARSPSPRSTAVSFVCVTGEHGKRVGESGTGVEGCKGVATGGSWGERGSLDRPLYEQIHKFIAHLALQGHSTCSFVALKLQINWKHYKITAVWAKKISAPSSSSFTSLWPFTLEPKFSNTNKHWSLAAWHSKHDSNRPCIVVLFTTASLVHYPTWCSPSDDSGCMLFQEQVLCQQLCYSSWWCTPACLLRSGSIREIDRMIGGSLSVSLNGQSPLLTALTTCNN